MFQALDEQDPVGKSGERVVHGALVGAIGGVLQVGPGLRVDEVRSRHIGQGLGRRHVGLVQEAGRVPVKVQRTELLVALAQRESKHRGQAAGHGAGTEDSETVIAGEIGDGDGNACPVGG